MWGSGFCVYFLRGVGVRVDVNAYEELKLL